MKYYRITFKNCVEKVIESENPVNLCDMPKKQPFNIGNAWFNTADVLIIEEIKPKYFVRQDEKGRLIRDCKHCRYEGLTYCIDCFNEDLFAPKG